MAIPGPWQQQGIRAEYDKQDHDYFILFKRREAGAEVSEVVLDKVSEIIALDVATAETAPFNAARIAWDRIRQCGGFESVAVRHARGERIPLLSQHEVYRVRYGLPLFKKPKETP
jgi:hypothetical protein